MVEKVPLPNVEFLGPKDVLIAVKACAVHWVDILMMMGQYQHQPELPYVPGMEFAGDVAWTGSNVKKVREGDRVSVDIFSAGPRSYAKAYQDGGFSSFAVVPEVAATEIPEMFNYCESATFSGAIETSHHALFACGKVKKGEVVLIQGATGASGLAAVQLCAAMGALVIATGGNDDKLDIVKQVGGQSVLATYNYNTLDPNAKTSLRETVKNATGGDGADVVFDTVGGTASEELMRCCNFGARFLVVVSEGEVKRG
eukprot:g3600.t1